MADAVLGGELGTFVSGRRRQDRRPDASRAQVLDEELVDGPHLRSELLTADESYEGSSLRRIAHTSPHGRGPQRPRSYCRPRRAPARLRRYPTRSMTAAMPCPPPMHIVSRP